MGKKVPTAAARLLEGHTFCKTFTPSSCLVASQLPKVQTKLERCGVSRSDWVVDLGAGVGIYKSGWCRINRGCKTKKPSFKSDYKIDHHLYGVRLERMHFPFPAVKARV